MKKYFSIAFFKVSLAFAGLTFFLMVSFVVTAVIIFPSLEFETAEVFLRSWESKTIHGEAVYNSIRYFKQPSQEIWMMNQSHHGYSASSEKWDRLAIVIKSKKAHFYQLPPGPLEWTEDLVLQKIDLKVDCRQCHSNGPRSIRPAPDFKSFLSAQESVTLYMLNLRMKFYGRLENSLWMKNEILPEKNIEKLNFPTCLRCHNDESKPWNRARLTLQQKDTIGFLFENKQMPPPGFRLTSEEKEKITQFLHN